MKHLIWTLAVTASLAAPLPAAGQHAVPRGGGDSGGGSSSSGGSSSGGSSGGSTSSGGSSSSDGGSSGSTWAPPRHPGGSTSSGGSRSGGSGSTASGRRSPGSTASSGSGPDRVVGGTDGHTRDGRPITGYAIPRGTVVPGGRPGGDFYYYPRGTNWYYSPWYYSRYSPYYYYGFGASVWGLGYIWDPFWFGPGYGFGGPWYGDPGYGGGGGYAGGGDPDEDEVEGQGALRIKVKPREAKVLVDGTFAGTVDDFDGNFQKLRLDEGAHKVELQAEGFEPLRFEVLIVEGQTVTYKGKLREH
jgi:PEGA domain